MTTETQRQFEFPVELSGGHRVLDTMDYAGDKFECAERDAYTHTGAWPTWSYCPYCGVEL